MLLTNIIDTHSHIHFPEYDSDREQVILRARASRVRMIAVGTDIKSSENAISLASTYPMDILGATVGFHPTYNSEHFNFETLHVLVQKPHVVAVGECGLDYFRVEDETKRVLQRQIFIQQIHLAFEFKKPLIVHCRNAFSDLRSILREYKPFLLEGRSGIIHFFSGSHEDAEDLITLGFYLGFGGVATFTRDYDEVIQKAPIDRVLVETDAPYVAPVPYRGKRNEPAYIIETVRKIAEIREEPLEFLQTKLLENTKKLFMFR